MAERLAPSSSAICCAVAHGPTVTSPGRSPACSIATRAPPSTGEPAWARISPPAPRIATPAPHIREASSTRSRIDLESTSSANENARSSGDADAMTSLHRLAFELLGLDAQMLPHARQELVLRQAELSPEVELAVERVPGQPQ